MYSRESSSEDSLNLPRAMSKSDMVHLVPTRSSDSISEIFSQANAAALVPPPMNHSRRGRSTSRETTGDEDAPLRPKATRDASKTTIRFAPLPETRPRSYSTGRNVFLEEADVTDRGDDTNPRRWVRRDQDDNVVAGGSALDTDDEMGTSPTRSMFGAWASDLASVRMARGETDRTSTSSTPTVVADSQGHRSESKNRASGRSDSKNRSSSRERKEEHVEESYTSKILRPLSFGLVKKKGARPSSSSGDSLSRTPTNESLPRPTGQGVPMRKTRTWEPPGEAPVRRANYPPVAQRSRKPKVHVPAPPDPKFIEWGYAKEGGGGGGGLGSVRSGTADADAEEDGSGMAWVKRRRQQKEAEAKEKERLAEEVAEKLRLEVEAGGGPEAADDVVDHPPESPLLTITEASSGTTTPMSASLLGTPRPTLQLDTAVSNLPHPAIMVTPIVIPPSPDITQETVPILEQDVDALKASNRLSVGSFTGNAAYGTDGEDSDDGGRSNGEDDSDLDEDELAAEEALVQEARIKASGAGTSQVFPLSS